MPHVPMGNPTMNVNDINMGSPTLINNPITVNQPTATMTQAAPEPITVSNIVAPDPIEQPKTFMDKIKNNKTEIIIALVVIAAIAVWYFKFRKK